MHAWVRTSLNFMDRYAVFCLSTRGQPNLHKLIVEAMGESNPDIAEALARTIILQERPELAGCVIYFIDFDPNRLGWRIGVAHSSLDPVGFGSEAKNRPMRKKDEEDQEAVLEVMC